jgi:hypothetical protein
VILSYIELVPIYDARDLDVRRFDEVLDGLASLPQFDSDVPKGSCAVIGHTISTFTKKADKQLNVSFNIHCVMVLGTPN